MGTGESVRPLQVGDSAACFPVSEDAQDARASTAGTDMFEDASPASPRLTPGGAENVAAHLQLLLIKGEEIEISASPQLPAAILNPSEALNIGITAKSDSRIRGVHSDATSLYLVVPPRRR